MSYDVAIWKSAKPLDSKTAIEVYGALGDAPERLEKTPALKKFHVALLKRFPALSEDNDDECPWAGEVELGDHFVLAPMSFSWVSDALFEIRALALKHGLDVFDPQKKKVLEPLDPKAKADPKKRLKADVAVPMLCRGLALPLKKLGFEATKREGVTGSVFVRKAKHATQELAFINLGGPDVDVHMGLRFPEVSAIIDPILADWTPPRGSVASFARGATIGAGAIYIALDMPQRRKYFTGHDICHQECVDKSIRAIPTALKRHTLPLFDELDTIVKVDAYLHQGVDHFMRAHDWDELPVPALAVAKLAKRKDMKTWIDHYAKRRAKSADLNRAWPKLLRAVR